MRQYRVGLAAFVNIGVRETSGRPRIALSYMEATGLVLFAWVTDVKLISNDFDVLRNS